MQAFLRLRPQSTIRSVFAMMVLVIAGGSAPPMAFAFRAPEPTPSCTSQDASDAESSLDDLTTWAELHRSFKRFGHCDDGAIAEGWSDVVGTLLSRRWDALPALVRLIHHDSRFEEFVLRHVDEHLSSSQVAAITRHAQDACPANAIRFCAAIQAKAEMPISSIAVEGTR